ncbi:MAG: hypothetical protein IE914_05410 [Thiotrichales bacterium]|nr:hypothetical protein [Thiotrichales bacterium]
MYARQRRHEQRGSISLLGALGILAGITTLVGVMQLANAKILDRHLDNYAESMAPVALRSELALSADMIKQGISVEVAKETLQNALNRVSKSGSVQVNLTFGNVKNGVFEPLGGDPNGALAKNPKAGLADGQNPPDFSAVALQLVGPSTYGFVPQGKAIYGLPEAAQEDGNMASCFCQNRYNACLASNIDTSSYPQDLQQAIGSPSSDTRKDYCMFGYMPSTNSGSVGKYQSMSVPIQFIGKMSSKDESGVIRKLVNDDQKDLWLAVNEQHPIQVKNGQNPFPNYFYNFFKDTWVQMETRLPAQKPNTSIFSPEMENLKLRDVRGPKGDYETFNDAWIAGNKTVQANGYYYVGQVGTCIRGTNQSNSPNISSLQDDVKNAAKSSTDSAVQRCLSYYDKVGDNWGTIFGFIPVHESVYRYMQQSCVDFNRYKATRISFFEWMLMSWTWPFIDWKTSYQNLSCATSQMRWYGSFIWGGWKKV